MNVSELLTELSERGVQLFAEGSQLNVRGPKGALTEPLRAKLATHKAEILRLLQERAAEPRSLSVLPQIEPALGERFEPFPLTDIQQAYWIGSRSDFELGNVSIHFYTEIDSRDLDIERLRRAWQKVVDRHDMLRAVMQPDGRQRILERVPPCEIAVCDLRGRPAAEVDAALLAARDELSHARPREGERPDYEIRATLLDGGRTRLHISVGMLHVDGPSLQILFKDLVTLYQSPDTRLPELELSFRDYVLAEQKLRETESFRRSLEYWKERVRHLPPAPQLPLAKNIGALTNPRFVNGHMDVDLEVWAAVKSNIQRHGLSAAAVLLTVYGEVLGAWSRSPQLTVNVTLFNRLPMHPQVNEILGDFTSMVLVDLDHLPTDSFVTRARRTQERLWKDLEHRQVSGVEVLRELARIRGTRSGALMPVIFTFMELDDVGSSASTGIEELGEHAFSTSQTPQVWLDHQVKILPKGVVLTWDGLAEIFPPGFMDELFAAYRRLLFRLAAEEAWHQPPRDLLPAGQLELRRAPEPAAPLPETTLLGLFLEQAAARPERLAVIGGGRELSYGELAREARRVGGWLRAAGARPETLVAVVMEKGWEQVVAVLGIHAAGAAYLPIQPSWPRERRWSLLAEGRVEIVLTQPHLDHGLEWPEGLRRLAIGAAALAGLADAPLAAAGPESLAYVIFTSGSTGRPKGVAIEHQGAVNTILDVNERFGVRAEDRVFALSSLTFDLSVYDVFGTLAAGAALVLPSEDGARDPREWADLLARHGVTVWNSVPALLSLLLDHADRHPEQAPASLRLALLSGDWLPLDIADRLRAHAPEARMISLGGATEASIWSILYPVEAVDPAWKSIPYGRPMLRQSVQVLNPHLQPCPVWVAGDLYIGGIGLARGYWGDEEKTRASFITHPETGERLYRTGDLGRYLPDGTIEFLGREDLQVKVQGFRIELGEIEAALAEHPAVRQAVVAAFGERFANQRLAAYYVAEAGEEPSSDELRAFLREKLPVYMVPGVLVGLPALPLSATGKVDRKALPDPEGTGAAAPGEVVAPRSEIEAQVAEIWRELLGLDRLSVTNNLIDYGGNSLTAIQVNSRLRETFGVDLPLRLLLDAPTVAGLAAAIQQLQEGGGGAPLEALPLLVPDPEARYQPFPLNDIQQAYWMGRMDTFELGNVAAHSYFEVEVPMLDLERMRDAWQCLIRRHDMLRAIVLPDGRQKILAEVPRYEIELLDLRPLSDEQAQAELDAVRRRMSHQVLPSDRWPLFEFRATRIDGETLRFHFSLDLLVVDAWSVQILFDDLRRLYELAGEDLRPLGLSFRDYLAAEARLESSGQMRRSREYWAAVLPELPPAPQLPLVKSPSEVVLPRFVRRSARLEPEPWRRLKERASAAGLTPSGVLLAAFGEILAQWSRSPRLTINVTTFRRLPLHPDVDRIIGDFTSLTLLEVDHSARAPFEALARQLQERLWQHLDHRFVSGVEVLRELARLQGRAPGALMPVVFTSLLTRYEETEKPAAEPGAASRPEEAYRQVYAVSQTPQVWLDHQALEEGAALRLNWDSVEELFPEGLLDDMFAAYLDLLRHLAEDEVVWSAPPQPRMPPAHLAQRAEVNATAAPVAETTLDALVERSAAEHPERPAVITAERTLSYGELWRRSARVARWLREQGARPDRLVAVVMEKGWEQAVAALAVVRSGAAYLPVDPAWPEERRSYLFEHGGVELALTQERLAAELAWPAGAVVAAVDGGELAGLDDAAEPLDPVATPSSLAYAIFTSGSTGRPKGVAIEHRAAVNTILDVNRRFGMGPEDRVLALSSLSFDLSVYDLFGMLAAGGALVMPEPWAHRDPSRWSELMRQHGTTVWNSVPALLELLLEHAEGREGAVPPTLRLALLSGDWLPVDVAARLRRQVATAEVVSLGGATEASIWSILHPVGDVPAGWKSIPYGRPMANQRFHVLDARLQPRPVWVPGDLYIGGLGLARCYWGDEEKTAASFFRHPETGERLYRTGDLGRWLPDGNIEFLGREDLQVKIQGYRIELGEIEAVLAEHPAVAAAVVVATGDPRDSREIRRLAGYVVPAAGETLDLAGLKELAASRLPSYMVPAVLAVVDEIPLTANGKVDRAALGRLAVPLGEGGRAAARTPLERELVALWRELLGVEEVGIHDQLFDLGGNSLIAIQMLGRLRGAFGIEVSLRSLFDAPTVAGLAAVIAQLKAGSGETGGEAAGDRELPLVVTAPEQRFEPFPLNDVQQAYLLGRLGSLELGDVAAHSYLEIEVETREPERVQRAWRRLIERHDMLRAVFLPDGRQRVLADPPPYEIEILDLVGRPAEEVEARLAEVRERLSHQVLPTDRWPLFELRISRLEEERIRIHISFDLLIADAWSSQILLREFGLLANDPDLELPPLDLTFRDYLLASGRLGETAAYARSRDYWQRRLPELPPAPQLPLVKDPASVEKPRFVRRGGHLDAATWQRLQERTARAGLTPSGLVLAAYAEVLAAWSASPRFTLNVTTFNRLPIHPQVNEVVGDFTSLTLLAADLTEADSFELRARRLQEQLWEDLDHRQVSGVQVVRDLARLQGRSPGALMPVVFTSRLFHGTGSSGPAPEGSRGEMVYSVSQTPQVWLDKQVSEEDGVLLWTWDAVEELFPEGLLDDMFAAFSDLLARLAEDEESWQRLSFDLVPPAHLAQRAEVNATAAPVAETTLDVLVERAAAEHPERPAVITAERTLSYGELWRRSARVARWLREQGARPDRLVAVVMEKGWEQAVAALAVVRSGAAYLPVDPAWPEERRFYLFEQGGVELALTQERLAAELAWPAGAVIAAVDGGELAGLDGAAEPLDPVATPSSLAYAIFTSGSTGRPKGVAIEHRAAVNTILDVNRRFGVGPEDRVLALSSLSFDLSVYDLFGMLAAGGALVMPEPWAHRDPSRWSELMRRHGTTVWNSVPALLELLLEHAEGREGAVPPTLRLALLSGDWLPVDVAARLRRQVATAEVVSMGGATEASIWSILYPVGDVPAGWKSIPYGRPMANQRFHVLDARLQPRPVWVPGDLYIAGLGLARCYWGDEEKTAASFFRHPETGERLYRTGDLGRWLPDGTIEFLGRSDFQVKIQGYRIELGEIEAALARHPGVAAAVVTAPEIRPGGQGNGPRRLVAYVVPRGGAPEATGEELRGFLGALLPSYMVPGLFIALERLPLTANGKVDRKALPAPERSTADVAVAAARTPLESRLATLWAELLGVEQVGIRDNLFDLGGNSLVAIQMVNSLRESFGVEVSLSLLFDHLTVESLAAAIAQIRAGGGEEAQLAARLPALVPDPAARHEPFPLNDVQQAYWVGRLNVFDLGSVAAHSYTEVEWADFDVDLFTFAFRRIIERHGALRLVFLPDGRQRILDEVPPYEVALLDLRGRPRDEAEAELAATRGRMSHQVLPADRWPLFEVRATRLAERRTRLHLSFDLLIADAFSSQILFRELAQVIADPRPDLFEPLEISFRDYVMAEQALKSTDVYRRSEAYWRERLATLPPAPELPLARAGESKASRFRRFSGRLPEAAWATLRTRAAETGVTPSGLLLAAFAEVLAAWSRSPRFTINLTTFNRLPLHPQVSSLMGDFTSLTLLAVDTVPLDDGDSFALRARRLQEQLWQDLDHRHFGGVKVLRELARLQGRAAAVLMPVVFTSRLFGTGRADAAEAPADSGEVVYSVSQTPQVWLDHQVTDQEEGLTWTWDAVEDLFPAGMIEAMFAAYLGLLERLAADEAAWRGQPGALLPAEQLAVRAAVNATEGPLGDDLLQTLFARQAAARGDAPAVIAAGRDGALRRLTYGELDRAARGIGRWLELRGAEPGTLVAVVMDKGWEQVAAVLGVLESGAAYLPIDPGQPPARLAHLLERGEVGLVLTQSWIEAALEWPGGRLLERLAVDTALADGSLPAPREAGRPLQGPADLAYVIFTSGSTGQPKGVAIEHRGAVNTILDVNRRFGIGPADRVLALSALHFDLSVYDVFGILAAGGTVVIPRAGSERDPQHWAELMREQGVTVWSSVPALMDMLVEAGAGPGAATLPGSLRLVLLSGDWVPLGLPARIREQAPEARVVSLGGATEASIWSILHPVGEVDPSWPSIPYGRPMANQTFHVLDARLEPRPDWVPGHLYIGGAGLARGYWRDEEKTAAAFLRRGEGEGAERLYRTGDLGRALPDGTIEFLGRDDTQVKIQGYRVELGEIEAALSEHPAVGAAVVLAPEALGTDPSAHRRRLVAYVARSSGTPPAAVAGGGPDAAPVDRLAGLDLAILAEPAERWQFQRARHGLRRDLEARPLVELPAPPGGAARADRPVGHGSFAGALSLAAFGRLLSPLRQIQPPGLPLPKYRYPSGGGLYPVQLYVGVRSGAIEGLAGGVYYYHPKRHCLALLSSEEIEPAAGAAFTLFFVGRLAAVCPLYPELGRSFCVLEAGYMGQLLMDEAPASGVGLQPLGGVDFEPLRSRFDLEGTDELVRVLAGGALAELSAAEEAVGDPSWRPSPGPETRDWQASPIYDPIGRLEFKLKQQGLRRLDGRETVELAAPPVDEELKRIYAERRSYHHYQQETIPLADLGAWLGCLRQVRAEGLGTPRARYLSAEHLYPVQTYLHVKEGRVEGLAGGTWYYDPERHRLVGLHAGVELDRSLHGLPNQPIFDEAAFSVFLVAKLEAIAPLYPEMARDLSLIEAGSMGQVLMTEGFAHRIGLTPLGGVGFEPIRHLFDLDRDHDLVHTFVGGRVPSGPATLESVVAEQQADARGHAGAPKPGVPPSFGPPSGFGPPPGSAPPAPGFGPPRVLGPEALPGADPARLREFLGARLPAYMVPNAFVYLDRLPLSANGKVDRKALPALEMEERRAQTAYQAPQNAAEQRLAELWREVLGLDRVGVDHNFFELGGTSVNMVQIHHRLEAELEREIPIVVLFEHPTVRSLAEHLGGGGEDFSLEESRQQAASRKAAQLRRRQRRRD